MPKDRVLFYSLLMNILVILAVIFIWASYLYSEFKNRQIYYEKQIIIPVPIQKEIPEPPKEITV